MWQAGDIEKERYWVRNNRLMYRDRRHLTINVRCPLWCLPNPKLLLRQRVEHFGVDIHPKLVHHAW